METRRKTLDDFSSILDESDGHKLVEFIRKKRGLRTQPEPLFELPKPGRISVNIEFERLKNADNPVDNDATGEKDNAVPDSAAAVENDNLPHVEDAVVNALATTKPIIGPSNSQSPGRSPGKNLSPTCKLKRVSVKRLAHSIGRRTLLKEFEKTIPPEAQFMPTTFSTPVALLGGDNAEKTLTPKASVKSTLELKPVPPSKEKDISGSPIIISDDSEVQENLAQSKSKGVGNCETNVPSKNASTGELMRDLQQQNDALLSILADTDNTVQEVENAAEKENFLLQSPSFSLNRTSTPIRSPLQTELPAASSPRRTFTIAVQKNNGSAQIVLTPTKKIAEQQRTPGNESSQRVSPDNNVKKVLQNTELLASPKFRKYLEQRFAKRDPKVSRIPIAKATVTVPDELTTEHEQIDIEIPETQTERMDFSQVHVHQLPANTTHIIESLQRSRHTSNAPLIVIPVSQTLNHPPMETTVTSPLAKTTCSSAQNHQPIERTVTSPLAKTTCPPVQNNQPLETAVTSPLAKTTSPPVQNHQPMETAVTSPLAKTTCPPVQNHQPMQTAVTSPLAKTSCPSVPNGALKCTPGIYSTVNYDETITLDEVHETPVDNNDTVCLNSLRLEDIITEDESDDVDLAVHERSLVPLDLARKRSFRLSRQQRSRANSALPDSTPVLPPQTYCSNEQNSSARVRPMVFLSNPAQKSVEPTQRKSQLSHRGSQEILDLRAGSKCSGKKFVAKNNGDMSDVLKRTRDVGKQIKLNEKSQRATTKTIDEHVLPLPPPEEFKDRYPIRKKRISKSVTADDMVPPPSSYSSSLIDEDSDERVSFSQKSKHNALSTTTNRSRRTKRQKVPEHLQKYLEISKERTLKNRMSKNSKRKLYSKGGSDASINSPDVSPNQKSRLHSTSSIPESGEPVEPPEKPSRPSPSPSQLSSSTSLSPSPPREAASQSNLLTAPSLPSLPPPLPPPTTTFQQRLSHQLTRLSQSLSLNKVTDAISKSSSSHSATEDYQPNNDSAIFKKPNLPLPKRVKPKSKKATQEKTDSSQQSKTNSRSAIIGSSTSATKQPVEPVACSGDDDMSSTTSECRRSKRGHKPLQCYWSCSKTTEYIPLNNIIILERRKNEAAKKRTLKKQEISTRSETTETPLVDNTKRKKLQSRLPRGKANLPNSTGSGTANPVVSNTANSIGISSSIPKSTQSTSKPAKLARGRPRKIATVATSTNSNNEFSNNQFLELDEVNISQTTSHAVARTPKGKRDKKQRDPLKVKSKKPKMTIIAAHEKSIAVAPPEHLNNLFEQLKSSTKHNNHHLRQPQNNNQSNAELLSASKKCCIRLMRTRLINNALPLTPQREEQRLDSGFSSGEIVNHAPEACSTIQVINAASPVVNTASPVVNTAPPVVNTTPPVVNTLPPAVNTASPAVTTTTRSDVLLSWLNEIINIGSKTSPRSCLTFRNLFKAKSLQHASVDDLVFQEIDGIEYAFYDTEEKTSFGYIRFGPNTSKAPARAKKYQLNFVILCGQLEIQADEEKGNFKGGDLITINKGSLYTAYNNTNEPALAMVIKK